MKLLKLLHTHTHVYTHTRIRRRYLYAISSLTSSPHPPIAFTRPPPFVPRREQRMFLPPSLMKIVHTYNGTKAGGKSGETRWNDGDNRGTMGSRYGIRSRFESPGITLLTKINEMVYSLCLPLSRRSSLLRIRLTALGQEIPEGPATWLETRTRFPFVRI